LDVPEKTVEAVTRELQALGVERGAVLEVHTSFRAVRPIENGPLGLIQALRAALGPAGTLVIPSFTGDDDEVFDPRTTAASPDLGIVADLFWRLPEVVRSTHPFAFAAAGPLAAEIVAGALPIPPHTLQSPVGRVWEHDGQVLLLGVGHDADTMLHLAELQAGVPYRVPKHITIREDGRAVRLQYGENDHCCQRFAFADDWLRANGEQSEGQVGYAHARLARARDIVSNAVSRLQADPLLFLHPPEAHCEDCNAARATVG
jgi:aminoglycoside 3-N-acetyltransferase-4